VRHDLVRHIAARLVLILVALSASLTLLALSPAPAAAQDESIVLRGTLTDGSGEPVPGVLITVSDDEGYVASETSDESGYWEVPIPGPGTYLVVLDTATLPEGVELRDPERSELSVTVFSNSKSVQFPIGEAAARGSEVARVAQLIVDGLVFGLIIALSGVGLSLVFGTTGLTNFSHGDLMTLGALAAFVFNRTLDLPFVLAAVLALLVCAAFGWGQDAGLWRPLRKRGTSLIAMLVVSIGFGILLRYIFLFFFGGTIQQYDHAGQPGLEIGLITITPKSVIASAVAIVALLITVGWLMRSRMGKASRAISDNPALASASGIDVERVINRIWIIGTVLAGLGGIIFSLNAGVIWDQGFQLLLLVFAAVVVGGLGSPFGAVVGGLIIGLLIQVSTLIVPPELKELGALAVLIVLLLVRPQGILGRAERVG
jgi:neutral amino acid transport system permease protein